VGVPGYGVAYEGWVGEVKAIEGSCTREWRIGC